MVWIIILICVLIIVFILFSTIRIIGSVKVTEEQQTLFLRISVFRIGLLEKTIDLGDTIEKEQEESFWDLNFLDRNPVKKLIQMKHSIADVFRYLAFHELSWKTKFGAGQAHTTGTLGGSLWALKGSIIGWVTAKSKMKCNPALSVSPDFNQTYFMSDFHCMITIKMRHAIYALLKMIRTFSNREEKLT